MGRHFMRHDVENLQSPLPIGVTTWRAVINLSEIRKER